MRSATENLSKILLINQSEAEVKIHLQIKEYQQLWPTPRIINIFPNPRRRKWKLAPVESLLDSDVELFTEDHKEYQQPAW
jgi:hypothetical protein